MTDIIGANSPGSRFPDYKSMHEENQNDEGDLKA